MKGNQEWKDYALKLAESMKPIKFGDFKKIYRKTIEQTGDSSLNYYTLVAFLQSKGFQTYQKRGKKAKNKAEGYVVAKVKGNKVISVLHTLSDKEALDFLEQKVLEK